MITAFCCFLLSLLPQLFLSQQLTPLACFHASHHTLLQPDLVPMEPGIDGVGGTYTYTLNWDATESSISQTAIALAGFQIQQPNSYLSFFMSINGVSASSVTVRVSPQGFGTQILQLQVSLLLVRSSCSQTLQLFSQGFQPSILSNVQRETSVETFTLSPTTFSALDPDDHFVEVFLKDFTATVPNNERQQVRISSIDIANSQATVTVESQTSSQNRITTLTLTVLIINKSAISGTFVRYKRFISPSCGDSTVECSRTTTYASDSQLVDTTLDATECTLPLFQVSTGTTDLTTRGVQPSVGSSSASFALQRMDSVQFKMVCLTECQTGYRLARVNDTIQCYLCNQTISGCLSCSSPTTCTTTCAEQMPGCTSCTSEGSCTSCSEGSPLATGCTTVAGCTAVTYVDGVSQCTACSSTPNGSLYNTNTCLCTADSTCLNCTSLIQCSICAEGYYLASGETACSSCNQQCKTCSNSFTCDSCTDGSYPSDSFCSACPTGCSTCLSETDCTSCDGGYELKETLCVRIETNSSTNDKWFILAMCLSSLGLIALTGGLCYWLRGQPGLDEDGMPQASSQRDPTEDMIAKPMSMKTTNHVTSATNLKSQSRIMEGSNHYEVRKPSNAEVYPQDE